MRLRIFLPVFCAALSALPAAAQHSWVATWEAAASPPFTGQADRAKAHLDLRNQTVREVVHTSLGGGPLRIRLSNEFNLAGVEIGAVHVAACDVDGAVVPNTDRAVTFSGQPAFTIPPNAPFISDSIQMQVRPASNLCISLFIPGSAQAGGIHYDARQKNFLASGNQVSAATMPQAAAFTSWFFVAGVDIASDGAAGTIVAFGDSITDGAASTLNTNRRWPNCLADRLLAANRQIAVVDSGIGGNRILHDAAKLVVFGVNALARYERDALGVPGAKYIIVLEGINDIGHPGSSAPLSEAVTADDLIAGMKQMIERAHEHRIKIFGATLTPFEGTPFAGYYTPEKEKEREKLNYWIRTSGAFDGVIDFDKATQDPANPLRMRDEFNSGDHLHPNDAGYKAMADSIDLSLFR